MNKKKVYNYLIMAVILLIAFITIDNLNSILRLSDGYSELSDPVRYSIFYALQVLLCIIFAIAFLRLGKIDLGVWKALGFDSSFTKGMFWAFIITSPMLLGYWLVSGINKEVTSEDVIFWSVISPFAEELFYRALLIGFMFRFLRIGFLPSALIVSVIFGLGHLYQAEGIMESLGVVGLTFFGSLLFGWLYLEWNNNLWIIFGMHLMMNLYWNIFDIGASNALGGWAANIFRFITIAAAIGITIKKIRNEGSGIQGRWIKYS